MLWMSPGMRPKGTSQHFSISTKKRAADNKWIAGYSGGPRIRRLNSHERCRERDVGFTSNCQTVLCWFRNAA